MRVHACTCRYVYRRRCLRMVAYACIFMRVCLSKHMHARRCMYVWTSKVICSFVVCLCERIRAYECACVSVRIPMYTNVLVCTVVCIGV